MEKIKQTEEQAIKRIEPLSWWIGMKTPLQLMIYGNNLAGSTLHVAAKGIHVKKIHQADNSNYIFADIEIEEDIQPGEYMFEIRKGELANYFNYRLERRRQGSALRNSFTSADMIYLLIPDRFANGDPSIDSTTDTTEKADRTTPFGRHGGDLQGIIDHLDYLTELGVTTLWLTPPQLDNEEKQSYHGYATADYYHIDPRLGNNNLYKELVEKAHIQGLKVIMDAVPNHCGTAHWWMKDLPFKEWIHVSEEEFIQSNYRLVTITDPNSSQIDQKYTTDGWFDKSMPDIAIEHPFALHYFLQLYIWWIEWADLDGLRVDTFPYNERYAIAQWTKGIRTEYPNLNIVAECWHSSPAVISYWDGRKINPDGYRSYLPSIMDFPLQEALQSSLAVDSTEWDQGLNLLYEAIAHDFLYTDPRSLLIFLDNHDTDRFADVVKGDIHKIKMGLTLLATLRGIPQLYYGTEFGFQTSDPEQGHGSARKDFPGGWKSDRKNLFTGVRRNKKEEELFNYTCKLFNWRKRATPIHEGKMLHFLPVENRYAFFRYTSEEAVFVLLNPTAKDAKINWKHYQEGLLGYSRGINILDGRKVEIGKDFVIKARESAIIELQK